MPSRSAPSTFESRNSLVRQPGVNRNAGRDPGWGTGVAAAGIPAGAGGDACGGRPVVAYLESDGSTGRFSGGPAWSAPGWASGSGRSAGAPGMVLSGVSAGGATGRYSSALP